MTLIEDHTATPSTRAGTNTRTGPADRRGSHRVWTDAELVAAAVDGDVAAFDELFARHRATVLHAAARVLGDRAEAQDAVQLTFVKTWQAVHRLDPAKPFGPWVRTVARRVALDLLRSRGRRDRDEPAAVEHESSAEVTWAAVAQRRAVRAAVDRLPGGERQVVLLTHFGGLSHPEVAARLRVPVGTVKSRSHRAHQRLAELLADR